MTYHAFKLSISLMCGPGRSVGIASNYGLDGPGSNAGGARFSAPPDRPGRAAEHSPSSSAVVMEE